MRGSSVAAVGQALGLRRTPRPPFNDRSTAGLGARRSPRGCPTSIALIAIGIAYAQASRTTWDGVYTEDQAKRGAALYSQNCAACHGTDLTGGESAPPLAGVPFFSNWDSLTVGDLFERIRVSMPADRPGRLSRDQNSDILAHMLKVNGFPAGKTELARQTELLKQIQLVMYRP